MGNPKSGLETELSEAYIKFQRTMVGRGPTEARTYIIDDMVILRAKGALTVEETHLAKTDRGRQVVKEMRQVLRETFSEEVEGMVSRVTGCKVISSHSDISTNTGERLEVYILDSNLERKLREADK